jgi:Flp pilus assembly pilin Flp
MSAFVLDALTMVVIAGLIALIYIAILSSVQGPLK